jgi:predicted amidohydrolase YtcJ
MRHRWVAVLVASVVGAAIPGALAIAGDRITLVGTDDAVRARAGASTQMT